MTLERTHENHPCGSAVIAAEQRKELCRILAKSLWKPEPGFEKGWFDEAEDRLAAYDRGEIASVTLDEVALREGREQARNGEFVSDEEVAALYKRHDL